MNLKPNRNQEQDLTAFNPEIVVNAEEFINMEIEQREELIDGLLYTRSLAMIFSQAGVGKTYLAFSMARAIACGEKFLAWDVPKPRRCLYVDGELPAADLQERARKHCRGRPPELLELISSEMFFKSVQEQFNLNNEDHKERFFMMLDELERLNRRPEVIFLDNLSSMTFGTDENSNSAQDPILTFLLELRHKGHTVIFLHHSGKTGRQRGASRREDFVDLSLNLSDPRENEKVGCEFVIKFSKVRRETPFATDLHCKLCQDEAGFFYWETNEELMDKTEGYIACMKYIVKNSPKTQVEIAKALHVTAGAISKQIGKGEDLGYLKGLQLTPQGKKFLMETAKPKRKN